MIDRRWLTQASINLLLKNLVQLPERVLGFSCLDWTARRMVERVIGIVSALHGITTTTLDSLARNVPVAIPALERQVGYAQTPPLHKRM